MQLRHRHCRHRWHILIVLLICAILPTPTCVRASTTISHNRTHDLHLVRHVQDVYRPPARGAYLYTLKLMHDHQTVFLDWVFSSILSLNDTVPAYDIVVLIDSDHRNATLAAQLHALGATRVVWVGELLETLPDAAAQSYRQLLQQRNSHAQYPGTWTKLLAWSMSDSYDKMVAMDADIMAYANADDILSYPELSAVPELLYPIISKEYLILFNAGLLVLQPNMDTFQSLVHAAEQFTVPPAFAWEGGDQIFLNTYFSSHFHILPTTYNLWAGVLDGFYRWPHPFHDNLRLVHHNRMSTSVIPETEEHCGEQTPGFYCTACCRRMVWLRGRVRAVLASHVR